MKINGDIKNKLEKLKPILKERYQVKTIGFFGSYARGEQNQKSDIDILVEFNDIVLSIYLTLSNSKSF